MAYFYGLYCIFHLKETTLWWKGVDTSKKNIYINSIYCLLPLCIYGLANGKKSQILKRQTNIWKVRDWDLSTHNYEPFIQGVKRYNELQESAVLGFQSLFFFCYCNTSAKFSKSNNYTKTFVTNNE